MKLTISPLKLIDVTANLKHKALLALIYSSGLRISEAINLKITDIDSQRMLIHIKNAKGKKDRYTLLSTKVLVLLKSIIRFINLNYSYLKDKLENNTVVEVHKLCCINLHGKQELQNKLACIPFVIVSPHIY